MEQIRVGLANQPLESRLQLSLKHTASAGQAAKRGDVDVRACADAEPGNVDAHDDTGLSALAWARRRAATSRASRRSSPRAHTWARRTMPMPWRRSSSR